jgi:hypothetical protein
VLTSELPRLGSEGISLVFASELCVGPNGVTGSRLAANGVAASGTKTAQQVSRASPPPSWPPSAQSRAPR